jgi:hypothetical protein
MDAARHDDRAGATLGRSRPQQPGYFVLGRGLDHDFRHESVKARVVAQGKVVEGAEQDPVGRNEGCDAVEKGAMGRGQGGKRSDAGHRGRSSETRQARGVRMSRQYAMAGDGPIRLPFWAFKGIVRWPPEASSPLTL